MATLREIRQRIKGVKNTQKITKAMKMVAAAKMRRAQDRMLAARPYADKIGDLVHNLVAQVEYHPSPLLAERPVERVTLVLVTSDRGLCGGFNANAIRAASNEISSLKGKDVELVCVGRKGYDFFKKRDFNIASRYLNIFNNLGYSHAHQIAQYLMDRFTTGETDAVKLIYNEFKSVAQQKLVTADLLPIRIDASDDEQQVPQNIDYTYEPSLDRLLSALLPKYTNTQVWRSLLESFASEQAARMMAMENATDNANELIQSLTLQFNKARQAAITKEILEIVGGAEALKSS